MISSRGVIYFISSVLLALLYIFIFTRITVIADELDKEKDDPVEYFEQSENVEKSDDQILVDYIGRIQSDQGDDQNMDIEDQDQNISEGETELTNNDFQIMVVFCFGLLLGSILGHYLTGFIK